MRSPVSQMPCTATARSATPPPIRSQTADDVSCASRTRNSRTNAAAASATGVAQQHSALREQMQILVVGLVDEGRPVRLLVDEHRGLVAAEARPREQEIANHAKRLLPDSRAAAGADRERFLHTGQERLHDWRKRR